MKPVKVSEKLSVAPQPQLADFPALKRLGFTAVINNRPDGEDPSQPGSAGEEEAAHAAGLAYVHIPVTRTGLTGEDARRLKEAVEQAPGPVIAHCRSGIRSFYLWVLSGALDSHTDAELVTKAGELGLDVNEVGAWLAAHRAGSAGDQK
jgi:uncharacterized protein (TIGR01244 family)